MEAVFPRQKGNRPDSLRAGGMATLLHEADATRMLTQWFEPLETRHAGAHKQLRFCTWSPLRQLSVWRIAEGLARHVPLSCSMLVQALTLTLTLTRTLTLSLSLTLTLTLPLTLTLTPTPTLTSSLNLNPDPSPNPSPNPNLAGRVRHDGGAEGEGHRPRVEDAHHAAVA